MNGSMNNNNQVLEFVAKTHEYHLDKKKIPSVTQILAPISEIMYEKIELPTLRNKAKIGSEVHKLIEWYSKYGLLPSKEKTDERVYAYFTQFLEWVKSLVDSINFKDEFKGFYSSNEMVFAGTIDNIRMIGNDLVLIDYKTVANPNKYLLSLQLYAYKLIAEQMLGIKINKCYALCLKTDSYEFVDITAEVNNFKTKEDWELLYRLNRMLEFNGIKEIAKQYNEENF